MLGRLFKLTSTQSLNLALHSSGGQSSGSPNSFDDSYTRGILYGLSTLLLSPVHLSARRFRLVVAQDGGALAAKQVLFDLVGDSSPASPIESQTPSPLAGPDLPTLQHKLSQVSLHGTTTTQQNYLRSVSLTPQYLPVNLDSLSPDAVELAQGVHLNNNHYFARENGSHSPRSSISGLNTKNGINRNVVLQKSAHNINVLTDYMFGRGLPSNEWHTATKIHFLPPLNLVHGTSQAVLVSRLFLIVDANVIQNLEAEQAECSSWNPKSTISPPERAISLPSSRLGLQRSHFTSRFSIGLIIPFDDPTQTVEETLASNWLTISMHLVILQKIVSNKLVAALKGLLAHHSPYITNKRISLPSYVFQGDLELLTQLHKLVKLIHYQVNVPRLISNHSLMMHTLNHAQSPFKANMINWALEVINWLEFKDGRNSVSLYNSGVGSNLAHSSLSTNLVGLYSGLSSHLSTRSNEGAQLTNTFLASLFALISSLRDSLSARMNEADDMNGSKEVTRVVVMTSNSTVAKKLIFLICALIPDLKFLKNLDFCANDEGLELSINEDNLFVETSKETLNSPSGLNKVISNKSLHPIDSLTRSEKQSNSSSPFDATFVKPIPIDRHALCESDGHSDDSVCASISSMKGWEVPVKSVASASFSKSGINPMPTKSVAIAQQIPNSNRNGNSSSMAYLSSSLTSSLSSSASNYSLSKLGSSFMDKWKHSLVGANTSHSSHTYTESFEPPMFIESLRKGSSVGNKCPSPAVSEENQWDVSTLAALNSPMKPRYSRTQSVFNVCNDGTRKCKETPLKSSMPNLERSAHSVYLPISTQDSCIQRKNENAIRSCVSSIFENEVNVSAHTDQSLVLKLSIYSLSGRRKPFSASSDNHSTSTFATETLEASPMTLQRRLFLQPHVAFVEEFRPECVVQSCPVNPKLESQVMSAMKNDLIFYQNTCGYKRVVSKTVFISLRARDIKLIELRVGGIDKSPNSAFGPSTPNLDHHNSIAHSPISSYFSGHENGIMNHERRGSVSANYKTTIKKIFSPGRNCGDKEFINIMEHRLERLQEVVSVMNGDPNANPAAKQELNKMLSDAVRELIS